MLEGALWLVESNPEQFDKSSNNQLPHLILVVKKFLKTVFLFSLSQINIGNFLGLALGALRIQKNRHLSLQGRGVNIPA